MNDDYHVLHKGGLDVLHRARDAALASDLEMLAGQDELARLGPLASDPGPKS